MTQAISNNPMSLELVVATKALKMRVSISLRVTLLITAAIKLATLLLHFVH